MATEKTEAELNAEQVLNEPLATISDDTVSETVPVADVSEAPATETASTEERPAEESATFQTPEELRAPVIQPAPTGINDYERQELEQLRGQATRLQQVEQQQEIDKQGTQLRTYYENQGWDTTTAEAMANIHKVEREQSNKQIGAMQNDINFERSKQNAANHYGKAHNVDPAELVGFPTPETMERHAKSLAFIAKQETRITKLEQDKIPEQNYDSGQGITSSSMNPNEILAAMGNNPDFVPTESQLAQVNKHLGMNGG